MRKISGYEKFLDEYRDVKDKSRLFLFVLFDDRPSHDDLSDFVQRNFRWLDSLAASANMYGFAFIDDDLPRSRNPSLLVATHFGIRPNKLPGIIFFTMFQQREQVKNGVYLPIKSDLFSQDETVIEDVFASVFTACQNTLSSTIEQDALMIELNKEIKSIRRNQKMRPVYKYLGKKLESLSLLPNKLLETVAESFGESLGRQIIP